MGPYRLRLAVDLPVVALGLSMAMLAFVEIGPVARARVETIHAIDRVAIGCDWRAAYFIANVLVAALVAGAAISEFLRPERRWIAWFLLLQTLIVTQGVTQLAKSAVRRSSPLVYLYDVADPTMLHFEASRSFLSGHAATAFAAAAFWIASRPRRWVAAAALPAAALVGVLKVLAGFHFPTDVLAGALVGASVGVLVPTLHR